MLLGELNQLEGWRNACAESVSWLVTGACVELRKRLKKFLLRAEELDLAWFIMAFAFLESPSSRLNGSSHLSSICA